MAVISDATDHESLVEILDSLLTDVTAQKSALDTLVAKMNLDGGITDVDYASSGALVTTS